MENTVIIPVDEINSEIEKHENLMKLWLEKLSEIFNEKQNQETEQ